jgi:hypothetical protein
MSDLKPFAETVLSKGQNPGEAGVYTATRNDEGNVSYTENDAMLRVKPGPARTTTIQPRG